MESIRKLPKFKAEEYYEVGSTDIRFADKTNLYYITPTFKGGELIMKYYADKYHANIALLDERKDSDSDDEIDIIQEFSQYNIQQFKKLCQEAVLQPGPYRKAFLVGFAGSHTALVIYIKEDNKHAFLFADSTGDFDIFKKCADDLKKTGALIYGIKEGRQSDSYSCHVDALALGCKAVAIDPETKTYLSPNLLEQLQKEVSENDSKAYSKTASHFLWTKLPTNLLFTAQRGYFLTDYQIDDKTLAKRKKYTKEAVKLSSPAKSIQYYHYLETKSQKYARIIQIEYQIQYYMDTINKQYPALWTAEIRKEFIKKAKEELNSQQLSGKENGLDEFSENFFSGIIKSFTRQKELEKEKKSSSETPIVLPKNQQSSSDETKTADNDLQIILQGISRWFIENIGRIKDNKEVTNDELVHLNLLNKVVQEEAKQIEPDINLILSQIILTKEILNEINMNKNSGVGNKKLSALRSNSIMPGKPSPSSSSSNLVENLEQFLQPAAVTNPEKTSIKRYS